MRLAADSTKTTAERNARLADVISRLERLRAQAKNHPEESKLEPLIQWHNPLKARAPSGGTLQIVKPAHEPAKMRGSAAYPTKTIVIGPAPSQHSSVAWRQTRSDSLHDELASRLTLLSGDAARN